MSHVLKKAEVWGREVDCTESILLLYYLYPSVLVPRGLVRKFLITKNYLMYLNNGGFVFRSCFQALHTIFELHSFHLLPPIVFPLPFSRSIFVLYSACYGFIWKGKVWNSFVLSDSIILVLNDQIFVFYFIHVAFPNS